MRYLPGPVDLQKARTKTMSKKWTPKKLKKDNVEKVGSYMLIYLHVLLYTSKKLYIPSYTPTYIKILNIIKMRANLKHKNGQNSGPRASPTVQI